MTHSYLWQVVRQCTIAATVLLQPSCAGRKSHPKKFDLICHGTAFTVFRPYPHTRGTGGAHPAKPWPHDDHYIVDLTTGQFCIDKDCTGVGHRLLAKVDGDRIFFCHELGMHKSVDLQTRKYVSQSEQDEGEIQAARGMCRFEHFSGFRC